jgi:hypothetical protein
MFCNFTLALTSYIIIIIIIIIIRATVFPYD